MERCEVGDEQWERGSGWRGWITTGDQRAAGQHGSELDLHTALLVLRLVPKERLLCGLCTFSVETHLMNCFRWTGYADFAARSVRLKNVSTLTPSHAVELL